MSRLNCTSASKHPKGRLLKPKLLFLITEDWFFCSHFFERAIAAREAGFDVVVAAREQRHGDRIRHAGLRMIPLEFARRSVNPWRELRLLYAIWRLYRCEQPSITHHIAAKPILYGSLAARLAGVRAIVNAPVGMGYVFSSADLKARMLRPLLNMAFKFLMNPRGSRVIFENADDLRSFVQTGIVRQKDAILIRGAGVDLRHFHPQSEPAGEPVVVLVSRMLVDKGINEFVAAAKILHDEGVSARFVLVGGPDPGNPASITLEMLNDWNGNFGVEWWGWRDDMVEVLSKAHIACLPSYREGLPKSLLEAAACGLPIVTTDVVGCREVVVDGENGLLVPPRDSKTLAVALKKLILDSELRRRMGVCGRIMVEREFSSERVIQQTLSLYAAQLQER